MPLLIIRSQINPKRKQGITARICSVPFIFIRTYIFILALPHWLCTPFGIKLLGIKGIILFMPNGIIPNIAEFSLLIKIHKLETKQTALQSIILSRMNLPAITKLIEKQRGPKSIHMVCYMLSKNEGTLNEYEFFVFRYSQHQNTRNMFNHSQNFI